MRASYRAVFVLAALSLPVFAQAGPPAPPPQEAPRKLKITLEPEQQQQQVPPAAKPGAAQTPAAPAVPRKVDHAAAYFHFMLAHMYEELATSYQQPEFASKAIEEYKLAIDNDPGSAFLNSSLAELYAKTGRIRDAVLEAQDIIKRDPNNLDARKLLARIYLRSLGDTQGGTQSQDLLRRAVEQYEAIVRLEPNSVDNHLLLGRLYKLNNDTAKAENQFQTAAKLPPESVDEHIEAITMLAYLYNDKGDPAKAIAALNTIPESDRNSKLYFVLGYTYEQQKSYKDAIAAYQKSVDLDHDNLDAIRGLAQNLLYDNQVDKALEQYKAVVDADPNDATSYLRIAEIYRKTGKFDDAIAALKKAEVSVPDSEQIPYNMAVIYEAQGRYDDSVQILQDLLKKSEKPNGTYTESERNNRSVFLERLGGIYRETNRPALAISTFREMLGLGADSASRGYQLVIDTYRDNKQWNDATATAQEAVNKLPKDRGLKLVLASQLADTGQPDNGLAMVRSMLKGTPEDREVYVALSQILARLKRWNEADEALAKADTLASKPEDKDYDNFLRASMLERQKKYEQAETLFKQVLARDPTNAVALNYLGYMLADRGVRVDEGLGYIKRAVQLDPENGAYLDSLGWAYFKMGNYDLAEANLRRAADKINSDPTVLDHLAEVYQKTGRLKMAAALWERAVEEWNKTVPAEVDEENLNKVTKKLESARVKLAKQQGERKAEVKPQQ